jgi:predicted NBD/HSP70 family sugar kinase
VPVSLENDANCALIAEAHDGALADCRNGVVLVLGTGTGGAVMIDGRIHHGAHFHSGNVSWFRSDLTRPDSPVLAELNGVPALLAEFARLAGLPREQVSGELLFARVAAGDAAATAALGGYCSRLAVLIYNLQVVLDLEVVAIGGGISAQPALIEHVAAEVGRQFDSTPVELPRPVVRPCRYRNDANLIGALRHHLAVAAVPRP